MTAFTRAYGDDTIMPVEVTEAIQKATHRASALPRAKIWLFPTLGPVSCYATALALPAQTGVN